jgi:hypothetical protein
MRLACGNNSVTGTISCNPSVFLTEFNSTSCASKWSGSISSTCGTFSLGVNNGICSNDYPPLWPITANLIGCPESCCDPCVTCDPAAVDCYYAYYQMCYKNEFGGPDGGCGDCAPDVVLRVPCGLSAQARLDWWSANAPHTDDCYALTYQLLNRYCCDGVCQDEPCCQPIDGVPTFRAYYSPEFCEPFCFEQDVLDGLPYDWSSFEECCAYNASIDFAPGIGPCFENPLP